MIVEKKNAFEYCLNIVTHVLVWNSLYQLIKQFCRIENPQRIYWRKEEILNKHDINMQIYDHTCMLVELEFQVS